MSEAIRTRRAVLASLTCAAGVSIAPTIARALSAPAEATDRSAELNAAMQFLIFRPQAAAALGHLYRQQHPQEDDTALLQQMTLAALAAPSDDAPPPPDTVKGRLEQRIRHEFTAGDTVQLHGWLLSRTEARLCALWH